MAIVHDQLLVPLEMSLVDNKSPKTRKTRFGAKAVAGSDAKPKHSVKKYSPDSSVLEHKPGFPIAGIGASVGRLDTVTELFHHLPVDTGYGFNANRGNLSSVKQISH